MEPEGSLPCLQESAIGPCPEPDESNPHPHTLYSFRVRLHLRLVSGHFPAVVPTKIMYVFLISPCVLHVAPIWTSPSKCHVAHSLGF